MAEAEAVGLAALWLLVLAGAFALGAALELLAAVVFGRHWRQ